MTFVAGDDLADFRQSRQPLRRAVRIRRKPQIDDGYRHRVLSDDVDRFLAVCGQIHFVVRKMPNEVGATVR